MFYKIFIDKKENCTNSKIRGLVPYMFIFFIWTVVFQMLGCFSREYNCITNRLFLVLSFRVSQWANSNVSETKPKVVWKKLEHSLDKQLTSRLARLPESRGSWMKQMGKVNWGSVQMANFPKMTSENYPFKGAKFD